MRNIKSNEVSGLLNELNLPLIKAIEQLRELILNVDLDLVETIKWNGPNYQYKNEDRITLRVQDTKQVQVIFHRGAKVKVQPINHLIEDEFNLLVFKENDRAILNIKSIEEVVLHQLSIQTLVYRWILASMD